MFNLAMIFPVMEKSYMNYPKATELFELFLIQEFINMVNTSFM